MLDNAALAPLTPGLRAGRSRAPRRRIDRGLVLSAVLHTLVVVLVILLQRLGQAGPPAPEEPGYEVVYEGGAPGPVAAPVPNPQSLPQVNLVPQDYAEPPPPPPQSQTETAPTAEAPMPRPRPRPRAQANNNPFAHVKLYDFGAGTATTRQNGVRGSHGLGLALGVTVQGGQLMDAVPHINAPGASGDYLDALSDYVESHKYYPQDAAENNEQGTAVVKAVIARDGTVKSVTLLESSGSQALDFAWIGLFRHKKLPPFPDNMSQQQLELTMSMEYEIIYRR